MQQARHEAEAQVAAPTRRRTRARRAALVVGLALVTAPLVAAPALSAPNDNSRLSQLRSQASTAGDDIGVRDAQADDAAARLDDVKAQVATATSSLNDARNQLRNARND